MPEKKKSVVPRLRFPEFRDAEDWEVKQIQEVCGFIVPATRANNDPRFAFSVSAQTIGLMS